MWFCDTDAPVRIRDCTVLVALQACRSHPCPNVPSVRCGEVSIKEGPSGKRGWDKCDSTEYYQQETACFKDKRCLVILAVMLHLLLACSAQENPNFSSASLFKSVLNHIRGCNTSMVVGEQCAIVDALLDKTQNQHLNHRILNHRFWHE